MKLIFMLIKHELSWFFWAPVPWIFFGLKNVFKKSYIYLDETGRNPDNGKMLNTSGPTYLFFQLTPWGASWDAF